MIVQLNFFGELWCKNICLVVFSQNIYVKYTTFLYVKSLCFLVIYGIIQLILYSIYVLTYRWNLKISVLLENFICLIKFGLWLTPAFFTFSLVYGNMLSNNVCCYIRMQNLMCIWKNAKCSWKIECCNWVTKTERWLRTCQNLSFVA